MQGMDMMRSQLGGTGMLGNQRAGMSGAAADVFGQYMQKAAPTMAKTGWDMMMQPYQGAAAMIPQTYSDLLVGHTPTIQQIQPGAAMSPEYMTQMQQLQQQLAALQDPNNPMYSNFIAPRDWGLGAEGTGIGGYAEGSIGGGYW